MRVLVVYCHPVAESFCAAMRDAALAGLSQAGHETRLIDLYAEGFEPRMSREERVAYEDHPRNAANVGTHVEAIGWAEGIVFVFPTWWYGLPAMLSGWLDRVWLPGVAFLMPDEGRVIKPNMTHIRLIAGITSCGSPWWWMKLMGEPQRRIILRGLSALCARSCRKLWLAHYKMDSSTEPERRKYLERIRAEMSRLN